MMASLYQSGFGANASGPSSLRRLIRPSYEVLEVVLVARVTAYAEDVRRHEVRVQLHEVAARPPAIARLAEEIVHLEGLVGVDAERGGIDVDPRRVRMRDVEVHHHQHGPILRALGITQNLVVVGGVEMQPV